uniref:Ig-like domain-containing protein n=1 Tax=Tetraodon nigroviridis TaxID=99883 RepID=H3C6Y9_TETNG
QDTGFLLANVGESVTLRCSYKDGRATVLSWYKQSMGKKLKLMSNFFLYGQEAVFFGEFRNNTRFKLATENSQHSLTISDLRVSDSATYYCMGSNFFEFEFYDGTTVIVKGLGSNVPASIRWLASSTIQPEDAAMPNCTVHTVHIGTCDGNHTVFWFRNSGPSELSLVYSHKASNNQCEKETHSCFYSLSMENLNISQTGTYYCAVAACGHILFGNRSKVEFEGPLHLYFVNRSDSVFAAAVKMIYLCIITYLSYFWCVCRKSRSRGSSVSTTEQCQSEKEEDHLHYAAVRVNKPNKTRRQRNIPNECVYSGVRHYLRPQ